MPSSSALVGRGAEQERLASALKQAELGAGSLVLVAGEAGVGKTRLVQDVAGEAALWGRASRSAAVPYGPIAAALRAFLRSQPGAFAKIGPLGSHLALLLPELGEPASSSDRATLFEAIRCALTRVAADDTAAVIVLEDLQWSDEATLELLPAVADSLGELSLAVIGTYRTDGLPRDHLLRRMRHELRRSGTLEEIVLATLEAEETAELLEAILGDPPATSLVRAIHDRTQGVPFFIEELARALLLTGSVAPGRRGLELAADDDVPIPDTVRDAVLVSAGELSEDGRAAADAAAVAGETFDLDVVADIATPGGVGEMVERGLAAETATGVGAFRHALAREALYADVPWLQRRALHRRLAEALERREARSIEIASHWLGAREGGRARAALLAAAAESRAMHAYRDAARALRLALERWPEGEDEERRIQALEQYAASCELSGEMAEAARAWREICSLRAAAGDRASVAEAQRRLAAVHDLRGEREAAFAARRASAEAFDEGGLRAEAAIERLAMGNYMRACADYSTAIDLARAAAAGADRAGRMDLRLRAVGLEGVALAKRGQFDEGLETVRGGLAIALEHDLTAVAAELYQRLSLVLYDGSDYRRAQETLETALALCDAIGDESTEVACVTCMVYVLRERGDWAEALRLAHELISSGTVVWAVEGVVGVIHAHQGKLSSARRLLSSSFATASRLNHFNMSVDTATGLARVAAAEGALDEVSERCRAILDRWEGSEDHHYSVRALRWAASHFARQGDAERAHACTEVLGRIAAETGHPDALAALDHAIAERALADGDADTAAERLGHAVELHRGLDLPLERAEIELRAGVALCAAGEREPALERLSDAYRTARKLGARPLAAEAAREVSSMGESVVRRLGRRAEADADGAGLSRRELEVVRMVAVGRTNREIAQDLFLSPRTVDMHVRNILLKLGCRSRVEAARRASERGLLAEQS